MNRARLEVLRGDLERNQRFPLTVGEIAWALGRLLDALLEEEARPLREWRAVGPVEAECCEPGREAAVGPHYASKAELLGDLARYAAAYGCANV